MGARDPRVRRGAGRGRAAGGRAARLRLPDRRLATLPRVFAELVAGDTPLAVQYARLCDELAAAGIPETIQIDDLHDGNVLIDGDRPWLFGWGDASISHPFFSLRVVLATIATRFALADDSPDLLRLRDVYLEPFTCFAPLMALRGASTLALRVAPAARTLAWRLALELASPDDVARWGDPIAGLVAEQRAALEEEKPAKLRTP